MGVGAPFPGARPLHLLFGGDHEGRPDGAARDRRQGPGRPAADGDRRPLGDSARPQRQDAPGVDGRHHRHAGGGTRDPARGAGRARAGQRAEAVLAAQPLSPGPRGGLGALPRARKSLGQHWLVDPDLGDRVLAAARIDPDDEVLEIGAGPGTLTGRLVELARRVVAVEVDRRLLPRLRGAAPTAEIVNRDVLQLDLAVLFPGGGEVVVGNIPYHLTGALLPRLLEPAPRPKRVSLVVQREAARRWCGLDGWSLATVVVQTFSEARLEIELPPEAFEPPPRVHSALVVMEVRPRPAVSLPDLPAFFRFAEATFQFRRKQLGGALARVTGRAGPDVAAGLRERRIAPSRRAETLDLQEWELVFRAFAA